MGSLRHLPAACVLAVAVSGSAVAQAPISVLTLPPSIQRTDTIDTWTRRGTGPLVRTATYHRSVQRTLDGGWVIEFRWHDTTGTLTSTHRIETGPGTSSTRVESVRSLTDSAMLTVADGRATGWVAPQGQPATLIDADAAVPFANSDVALLAIAATQPGPGLYFVIPYNTIFSVNPTRVSVDTLRTLAPDRLRAGARTIECQTLVGPNGETHWIERATGVLRASRTTIGPFTHWHVVRGITPPT